MNKLNFDDFLVKQFEEYQDGTVPSLFLEFEMSFFVFDLNRRVVYVSTYLLKRFHITLAESTTIGEVLGFALDPNVIESFYDLLNVIKNELFSKITEFPIKMGSGYDWYRLELRYNQEQNEIHGIFHSQRVSKHRDFYMGKEKKDLVELIELLPHPVFLFESDEIVYSNQESTEIMLIIHELIQKELSSVYYNLKDYPRIIELKRENQVDNSLRFSVVYREENQLQTYQIVTTKNEAYTLYSFIESNIDVNNAYLQKVLRANELVIEIRDLIENTDDIREVFRVLLSKIHTVIDQSDRCCVLRVDNDYNLYMCENYGFNDDYVDAFVIPFKKSYAYMHMQNDYTKSVIINDVRKRYSMLFPDVRKDSGYQIESNVTTPLVVNGNLYGIMSVDSEQNEVFDQVDLYLLDFIKLQVERAIEKQEKLEEIKLKAMIDPLTGLINRREIMKMFDVFSKNAKASDEGFLFVIFDIDRLKYVNDTFGHNIGDKVIKQFAFTVKSNTRGEDVIGRIGGDEFVGLFKGISEELLNNRIIEWQKNMKVSPIVYKKTEIVTEFSYGIVTFPKDGVIYEEILEKADKKLYKQKEIKRRKC
jgi:diguanylate cyclase (GGDEF)-like protein